jgi:tetratricopeptide (TPR) repeat protein
VTTTPEKLDQTAAELQAGGRWDEYLELTGALVEQYPQRADVHLHRARALTFGAGRPEEGLVEVQLATLLTQDEAPELMRLAAVRLSLGVTEGVDEYIERAVRAAGLGSAAEDPSLAYLAGTAALAHDETAVAQALLEAAVAGDPWERDYVRDLARLYVRLGHTDRARAIATRALEASPDDERLQRLAHPVPAEVHGDAWRVAATQALDGRAGGLLCPVYGDGELAWTEAAPRVAGERRYRLYCPLCGAEVVVNLEPTDAA